MNGLFETPPVQRTVNIRGRGNKNSHTFDVARLERAECNGYCALVTDNELVVAPFVLNISDIEGETPFRSSSTQSVIIGTFMSPGAILQVLCTSRLVK